MGIISPPKPVTTAEIEESLPENLTVKGNLTVNGNSLTKGTNTSEKLVEGKGKIKAVAQLEAGGALGTNGKAPPAKAPAVVVGAFKKGTAALETEAEMKKLIENLEAISKLLKELGFTE